MQVKWIKLCTDIFDDEKILLIESLPDCYAIITVWFKLLCLAGKQNNSGVFMMGQIAYTDKMLATIFPDKPITKKPADVRMGKGKGNPEGYVAPVTPGRMLFEVEGVPFAIAKEALRLAAQKLPITTKFVVRRDYDFESENA